MSLESIKRIERFATVHSFAVEWLLFRVDTDMDSKTVGSQKRFATTLLGADKGQVTSMSLLMRL
jgi:hypothetical protein